MRRNRWTAELVVIAVLLLAMGAAAQSNTGHWVATWGASPHAPVQFPGMPPIPSYENQTIRMVVRLSAGGERVRIRFSNAFGASALKIGSARIALAEKGSKIIAGSDRALTFAGQKGVAIPPGAPALSDPVDLKVPALSEVAVSIFLPESTQATTTHLLGQYDTYVGGPGDITGNDEIPNPTVSHSWPWLSGVDVWTGSDVTAIVTLGDSITDGFGAKPGEYHDWPNQFAKRLAAADGTTKFAVVNEGIGGNRILHDGMGVNALERFDRDVLANPGITQLLVLEGINDLGWPHMKPPKGMDLSKFKMPDLSKEDVTAGDLISGMRQIIDRAHEHGIKVYGATMTPFEGADYFSDEGEATRQSVNRWIRTGGAFDGVVDFDYAVRDPAHPTRFREGYHSGDFLHPNDAGYKAMADAIDISFFKRGECATSRSGLRVDVQPLRIQSNLQIRIGSSTICFGRNPVFCLRPLSRILYGPSNIFPPVIADGTLEQERSDTIKSSHRDSKQKRRSSNQRNWKSGSSYSISSSSSSEMMSRRLLPENGSRRNT